MELGLRTHQRQQPQHLINMTAPRLMTKDHANLIGFSSYNNGPHLCVEVPDGSFTISARTSSGKNITFSFLPYKTDGEPKCVDVYQHNTERQRPILFTKGSDTFHWKRSDTTVAITSIVLEEDQKPTT